MTRSFRRSGHTATMWKTFYLLSLMLFTFDFPRNKFTYAGPNRVDAVLARPNVGHDRTETRRQIENTDESSRAVIPDDEDTSELVGKWRNNGEALEPKWRDGDTVPLLPFSHFSQYSRDEIDSGEEEDGHSHQGLKYGRNNTPENYPRTKTSGRISRTGYGDYEQNNNRWGYGERDEAFLHRRRNRPLPRTSPNVATSTSFLETSTNDGRRKYDSLDSKDVTSIRYRETFQIRPNDYEHELDDEEYLKPRPRKRRPPQNYEFALAANEALLRSQKVEDISRTRDRENTAASQLKNAPVSQNAMEIKSLLKMQQEEGLSLSEILQRRNLTLNDLLKGRADAISALKSKDVDEIDEYNDEILKVLPHSKVSSTEIPRWSSTTDNVKITNSENENKFVPTSIPYDTKSPPADVAPTTSHKNSIHSVKTSSNDIDRIKVYLDPENAVTGKFILSTLDPMRANVINTTSVSTTITTSTPLLIVTNSMELFQNDDSTVKLQNNREIKSKGLDRDEIMEFSDFPDYKKGRNSMPSVWLTMKNEEDNKSSVENADNNNRNMGSTLSIEQILSSTERIASNEHLPILENDESSKTDVPNRNTGKINLKDAPIVIQHPTKDYPTFLEDEYQDDTPFVDYNAEHTTKVNIVNEKNDMATTIMRDIKLNLESMAENNSDTANTHETFSRNDHAENDDDQYLKNHQALTAHDKRTYDEIISEIEPEARAEIFELFTSGSAGKRLERLLKSRNMSLDELIALRQRGSSKVHLAEVSRLKIQKPDDRATAETKIKIETTTLGTKENLTTIESVTAANANMYVNDPKEINNYVPRNVVNKSSDTMSNLMNFVRFEKTTTGSSRNYDSDDTNEKHTGFKLAENQDEDDVEIKETHRKVEIVDLLTTFASLPFANGIQREITGDYNDENERKLPVQNSTPRVVVFINNSAETIRRNDSSNVVQSGYVEEVVKEGPNSIDIRTVYSETSNNFSKNEETQEEKKALSRMKPSIIASGAILGVTIVVFLAIFIACRIRQKQKYRYRNSFSRAVFQGPVLAARKLSNSSSLNTVMVNVVATSTTKRPDSNESQETAGDSEMKSDIDNDSLDANDSWETIPDYMK